MEMLLRFVLPAAAAFLMILFGLGFHRMGQKRRRTDDGLRLRWMPPAKDVDPVCGKTVTTDRTKPSVYAGNVHYFCSRACREVFEAAPQFYVSSGDADQRNLEHSHV